MKNNKKLLKSFIESDIQWSPELKEEILDIIKNTKDIALKNKNLEFIWNSFELTFRKNKIKLYNQFTEEKSKYKIKFFLKCFKESTKKITN